MPEEGSPGAVISYLTRSYVEQPTIRRARVRSTFHIVQVALQVAQHGGCHDIDSRIGNANALWKLQRVLPYLKNYYLKVERNSVVDRTALLGAECQTTHMSTAKAADDTPWLMRAREIFSASVYAKEAGAVAMERGAGPSIYVHAMILVRVSGSE
ncbi:hypothetical protein BC826DRAFT_1178875 [Russula brevipes]|nr:hypothetical protein BC826DRAFT_1178875 [Russula brevipes]